MKLSTRVRYGLRAMIELALDQSDKPVLVKTISQQQHVSKKYLENLLIALKNAGLVRSIRGAKGGYVLARPSESITVKDIITALEGPITFIDCVGEPETCNRVQDCAAHDLWRAARDAFVAVLEDVTLDILVDRTRKKICESADSAIHSAE